MSIFSYKKPLLQHSLFRTLFFLSLFFGMTLESANTEIYAAPITSNTPISMDAPIFASKVSPAKTTSGSNTSTSHPILHALANLFHIHSSHTINTASVNTKSSVSTQKTALSSTSSTISSTPTFLDKHPLLNEISHYIGDVFGPKSYKPSVETQSNSAGKVPVILVHGTWSDGNWMSDIYHSLDKAGIPAYAKTFGTGGASLAGLIPFIGGVAPVAQSEKELSDYIAQVQKETGASKVDLVGHSQGGLLIKDYIAHDNKDNIQAVVDMGATNHGTTENGASSLLYAFPKPIQNVLVKVISFIVGQGATDQLPQSSVITDLNKYPDTKAGIHYLVLGDRDDTTSTPYQNTYLTPVPGADVTNVEIHSLPGVTGKIAHDEIPITSGVVNTVTQYITAKGEPSSQNSTNESITLKTILSSSDISAVNHEENSVGTIAESPKITPPVVSLLG